MSFVAIEKDFQAKVSEKVCLAAEGLVLARFSDVCEKQTPILLATGIGLSAISTR